MVADAFQWCVVVSQPRSCNSIADKLAEFGCALSCGGVVFWPGGHPEFVNSFVAAESASS